MSNDFYRTGFFSTRRSNCDGDVSFLNPAGVSYILQGNGGSVYGTRSDVLQPLNTGHTTQFPPMQVKQGFSFKSLEDLPDGVPHVVRARSTFGSPWKPDGGGTGDIELTRRDNQVEVFIPEGVGCRDLRFTLPLCLGEPNRPYKIPGFYPEVSARIIDRAITRPGVVIYTKCLEVFAPWITNNKNRLVTVRANLDPTLEVA